MARKLYAGSQAFAWYLIRMRKVAALSFALVLIVSGCGESATSDGGAGGRRAGTAGTVEWVARRLLHPRLTRLAATSAPMKPKVFLASKVRPTWCRLATSSACATTRLMCRVAPSGSPSTTACLTWIAQTCSATVTPRRISSTSAFG